MRGGSIYEPSHPWRILRSNTFWALYLVLLSPLLPIVLLWKLLNLVFSRGKVHTQEGSNGSNQDETMHNSDAFPSKLDYGIFWFGLGNRPEKFSEEGPNIFFDPSKPSVLVITPSIALHKYIYIPNYPTLGSAVLPRISEDSGWTWFS
jgi:hypothetical protein